MYLKELSEAVKRSGFEKDFEIMQIKEKYGALRCYCGPIDDEIVNITTKYEALSEYICISCGKPDVPMTNDRWLLPQCFDCYKKTWRKREKYISKQREIIPATEEEIRTAYEKSCNDSDARMPEKLFVNRRGETEEIDISETANAIRQRWKKRTAHSRKMRART